MTLMSIVNGVKGFLFFGENLFCQSCCDDISDGKMVVSETGRVYCNHPNCLRSSIVFGDEVRSPAETGKIYRPWQIGYAVGGGRLNYFRKPSGVRRSGR